MGKLPIFIFSLIASSMSHLHTLPFFSLKLKPLSDKHSFPLIWQHWNVSASKTQCHSWPYTEALAPSLWWIYLNEALKNTKKNQPMSEWQNAIALTNELSQQCYVSHVSEGLYTHTLRPTLSHRGAVVSSKRRLGPLMEGGGEAGEWKNGWMNERKVTYLQGLEQVSFNGAFPFQCSDTLTHIHTYLHTIALSLWPLPQTIDL